MSKVYKLICLKASLIFSSDSDALSRGWVGMKPVRLIILVLPFKALIDFRLFALKAEVFWFSIVLFMFSLMSFTLWLVVLTTVLGTDFWYVKLLTSETLSSLAASTSYGVLLPWMLV